MKALAHFSFETNSRVALTYADGEKLTVSVGKLAKHLGGDDLRRVRSALERRKKFIGELPPWAGAFVIGIVLCGGALTGLTLFSSHQAPPMTHQQSAPTQKSSDGTLQPVPVPPAPSAPVRALPSTPQAAVPAPAQLLPRTSKDSHVQHVIPQTDQTPAVTLPSGTLHVLPESLDIEPGPVRLELGGSDH